MEFQENLCTKVNHQCDVFVLGGGIAGISAAIAAARQNKKVILVEKSYMLGGLATSGLVTIYLPLDDGNGKQVSFGIAEELLRLSVSIAHDERYGYLNWVASNDKSKQTAKDPRFEVEFNPQLFAISCEQLLTSLGVTILYGTYCVNTITDDNRIKCAIIEGKSGRQGILAKTFIDASGDCDLAYFSKVPTSTFKQGNVLAGWYYSYSKDGYHLHQIGCCDISDEEKKKGVAAPQTLVQTRFSGLSDEEVSNQTILSHAFTLKDVLAKREKDESYIPTTIATIPQIRMTRKIDGEFTQHTSDDHKYFEDSIGLVSDWRKRGPIYEVPFRCLYNSKMKNLICCGRNTSCDEGMWEIMRVIPCCAVTGEAAGVAASITDNFPSLDIKELQKALKDNKVVLHIQDL